MSGHRPSAYRAHNSIMTTNSRSILPGLRSTSLEVLRVIIVSKRDIKMSLSEEVLFHVIVAMLKAALQYEC